uniref:Uncharacterized protein n=1 Tax=Parascaris equorum TaxID=6256 RepID=A0A914RJP1_PAREQ
MNSGYLGLLWNSKFQMEKKMSIRGRTGATEKSPSKATVLRKENEKDKILSEYDKIYYFSLSSREMLNENPVFHTSFDQTIRIVKNIYKSE